MNDALARRAAAHGVQRRYQDADGRWLEAPPAAVRALLAALDTRAGDAAPRGLRAASEPQVPEGVSCYLPPYLERGRVWGVGCQLYALRSARNWGIGDFEDLARLGEHLATRGADFLGVNPLHALFLARPDASSPFSPSDRMRLNPLYIAIDRIAGYDAGCAPAAARLAALRSGEHVDYAAVAAVKLDALARLHRRQRARDGGCSAAETRFRAAGGEALQRYAVFEALSLHLAADGVGAGWLQWPQPYRDPHSRAVARFAHEHAEAVDFQLWLQWLADCQLGEAAHRLRAAGMRIGLYLDLAVGVAPDGAATWSDRELVVSGVEIGAPPDQFNPAGQCWGLAPLAPDVLAARDWQPLRGACAAVMRHAGAVRLDHAMSLHRLFWIPQGFGPADGAYVLYPMSALVRVLAEASHGYRAVVVGEDLGAVPAGFRAAMTRARMLGYRVFYFERTRRGFAAPSRWPRDALACVGSHDTPTLAGWWRGRDIEVRRAAGLLDADAVARAHRQRGAERRAVRALLTRYGADPGAGFDTALAVAIHRTVARTRSRLMIAQLDDLLGLEEQVNLPGTVTEYPNWRQRVPVAIEALDGAPLLASITHALAHERPREP